MKTCVEESKYNTMLSNIHMDKGGSKNREQQDSAWIHEDEKVKICVIADGHGREHGRTASLACIKACQTFFTPENIERLLVEPYKTLTEVFVCAFETMKADFIVENAKKYGTCEETGDEVSILTVSRMTTLDAGSTMTITVFTDEYIYTANVSDSKTLLMTNDLSINQSAMTFLGDSARDCGYNKYGPKKHFNKEIIQPAEEPFPETAENVNVLELTASHSPTDWREFERLVAFRSRDPLTADKLPYAELKYPDVRNVVMTDIFTEKEGVITKSEEGHYYKNVSHEFASTFGLPDTHQNLAMTRSIGDYYGIPAGLSHRPEVRRFDLKKVFDNKRRVREESASESNPDKYIAVVMGSDGIWDNWTDVDVKNFILYPNCVEVVVAKGKEGVNEVAIHFASRNSLYANRNFGSSADNASCIVAMIHEL